MHALTTPPVAGGSLDWPSLAWAAVLMGITLAVLAIKSRYVQIADMGLLARVSAHSCIGYFSVGMIALGMTSIGSGELPVPGGTPWTGGVAIIGGFAALVAGSITLGEHVAQVVALQRVPVAQEVPVERTQVHR